MEQTGEPQGGKALDGKDRAYGQYGFDHYSIRGTTSNCKRSPPEKQFSVERSLTNINILLVSESKSSAVLHGIAMEGRATAIFQFDSNIYKILECFSLFQISNKTYSTVSRDFGYFRDKNRPCSRFINIFLRNICCYVGRT